MFKRSTNQTSQFSPIKPTHTPAGERVRMKHRAEAQRLFSLQAYGQVEE